MVNENREEVRTQLKKKMRERAEEEAEEINEWIREAEEVGIKEYMVIRYWHQALGMCFSTRSDFPYRAAVDAKLSREHLSKTELEMVNRALEFRFKQLDKEMEEMPYEETAALRKERESIVSFFYHKLDPMRKKLE